MKNHWFVDYQKRVRKLFPFSTPTEAKEACEKAVEEEEKLIAFSRWTGLSNLAMQRARNLEETAIAYEEAPPRTSAKRLGKTKLEEYAAIEARNSRTIEEAFLIVARGRELQIPGSFAAKRIAELAQTAAEELSTIEECQVLLQKLEKDIGFSHGYTGKFPDGYEGRNDIQYVVWNLESKLEKLQEVL